MKKKYYVISLLIIIMDIVSKIIVKNFLPLNRSIKIIDDFLYLTYSKNIGVAFSFFSGAKLFIILSTILILVMIIYYILNNKLSKMEYYGFFFIIGGAIGNLIDRIIYGYVIDFIDIYIFNYDYPIFNIADIAVVSGVILLIINNFIKERRKSI